MAAILPRPQWVKNNDTMETINPTSMIIYWEKHGIDYIGPTVNWQYFHNISLT